MKVKIISHSAAPQRDKTPLELVAYCARVSNPSNQNNSATSEKLVKYLVKHKHWSPLEMVNVCLEIETTRDIARQLLRHRSFTFQEFSQRYANPDQAFDDMFEKREARMQDEKNRQNSVEVDDLKIETEWFRIQSRVEWMCKKQYQAAIKLGIAKEQARALLPEGLTKSRLYVSGSLRSWIHYIDIRSGNGTQKEHMDLAKACGKIIYELFPVDLNESSN
ncbi:MAG TPA: FAD-dependent thymidylate synthase [Bacteroidetes bacterium]|nr:FAD-dependent thymidylate synthase [Bacteroidota bacterium]